MTVTISDDLETVPPGFRGVYESRVRGLKAALASERRWNQTLRKMQSLHPELRPIIIQVDHLLKTKGAI